jgi:hypothetical protein
MSTEQSVVTLSGREYTYLKNTSFLPSELARLIHGASSADGQRWSVDVSRETAEEFRSVFTLRLATVGFDEHYEPTSEGKLLEQLIDRFNC